jgi:excisionase family DNA binding protein
MSQKLWTIKEVAAHWRVSEYTVMRLIHAQQLEARSVGRSYRIPDDAVHRGTTPAPKRAADQF